MPKTINIKSREVRVTGISSSLKSELANVAKWQGSCVAELVKGMVRKAIETYPSYMRETMPEA